MPPPTGSARSQRPERRHRRFKLRYPVHLSFRSDTSISEADAITRNVSIGGLLLECPVRADKNATVTFTINMGGAAIHALALVGDGQVVRVESGENGTKFLVAVQCTTPITQLDDYLPTVPS